MKVEDRVFNKHFQLLPTIEDWSERVAFDSYDIDSYNPDKFTTTWHVRSKYTERCFPILSDEFMNAMVDLCSEFHRVSEFACGEGWLSYWLMKYGVKLHSSVDNKSWKFKQYQSFVKKYDAEMYLKRNTEIDLIIMSWPNYDEPFAHKIWKGMKKGQHLLYIGESYGGCTADDDFHKAVEGHEVEDVWGLDDSFKSFDGIHDRPIIYKK